MGHSEIILWGLLSRQNFGVLINRLNTFHPKNLLPRKRSLPCLIIVEWAPNANGVPFGFSIVMMGSIFWFTRLNWSILTLLVEATFHVLSKMHRQADWWSDGPCLLICDELVISQCKMLVPNLTLWRHQPLPYPPHEGGIPLSALKGVQRYFIACEKKEQNVAIQSTSKSSWIDS